MADLIPVHIITAPGLPTYYIRTSDVYGETGGIGAKVGIKKVKDTDLTGKEEIIPVKELLRTGVLLRMGIRYKLASGARKSARILVTNAKMTGLFGADGAAKLEGDQYKIGSSNKGIITSIGMLRRASAY